MFVVYLFFGVNLNYEVIMVFCRLVKFPPSSQTEKYCWSSLGPVLLSLC